MRKAFTLIEVLVIVAIIATILALVLPMMCRKDPGKALSFGPYVTLYGGLLLRRRVAACTLPSIAKKQN